MTEDLKTPQEVADRLRVQKSWLYQRAHTKTLPFEHVKVGRYLRFPAEGIEQYLRKQRREGM